MLCSLPPYKYCILVFKVNNAGVNGVITDVEAVKKLNPAEDPASIKLPSSCLKKFLI